MSLSFRSVVMDIADIKVPFDSLPKTEKIKECYAFFRKYGLLDRQIIVDGDNVLRDGLVGLMVARAVDLKQLKVLQVREKTKALPATEKTIAKKMRETAKVKQLFSLPSDIACATELDVVCVKTGGGFTRGRTYHYKDAMTYDDGRSAFYGQYMVWVLGNPFLARGVVPLVHRPAEVGEWIRLRESATCFNVCQPGDILPVVAHVSYGKHTVYVQTKNLEHVELLPDRPIPNNVFYCFTFDEYDVLEGYDGRYEPQEDANDV